MGGAHRRHWASSLIAQLASIIGRMLWRVESRRPLLFLPRLHTRRMESLGPARIYRHYSKTVFHSLPTDYGSFVLWLPGTQPGRQETLYGWPTGPGRARPLRRSISSVRAVPFRHLGRGTGLLTGRQVGHLCVLSRLCAVAQSRGR